MDTFQTRNVDLALSSDDEPVRIAQVVSRPSSKHRKSDIHDYKVSSLTQERANATRSTHATSTLVGTRSLPPLKSSNRNAQATAPIMNGKKAIVATLPPTPRELDATIHGKAASPGSRDTPALSTVLENSLPKRKTDSSHTPKSLKSQMPSSSSRSSVVSPTSGSARPDFSERADKLPFSIKSTFAQPETPQTTGDQAAGTLKSPAPLQGDSATVLHPSRVTSEPGSGLHRDEALPSLTLSVADFEQRLKYYLAKLRLEHKYHVKVSPWKVFTSISLIKKLVTTHPSEAT